MQGLIGSLREETLGVNALLGHAVIHCKGCCGNQRCFAGCLHCGSWQGNTIYIKQEKGGSWKWTRRLQHIPSSGMQNMQSTLACRLPSGSLARFRRQKHWTQCLTCQAVHQAMRHLPRGTWDSSCESALTCNGTSAGLATAGGWGGRLVVQ